MLNKFIVFLARAYYWLAERLYHELAWAYDPISWLVSLGQWGDWRKAVLPLIRADQVGTFSQVPNSLKVLEIGFGTGELLLEVSHLHSFTVGLEASSAMQRVATRKIRKLGLAIPRLRGVSQALPFCSASFDTVISTFPSNYIFDPETWMEVARVLRPPPVEASAGEYLGEGGHLGTGGSLVTGGLPVTGGRFIVVGVCLVPTRRTLLPMTWVNGATVLDQLLDRFNALALGAGLTLQVHHSRVGSLILPVLVAGKAGPLDASYSSENKYPSVTGRPPVTGHSPS